MTIPLPPAPPVGPDAGCPHPPPPPPVFSPPLPPMLLGAEGLPFPPEFNALPPPIPYVVGSILAPPPPPPSPPSPACLPASLLV